jgi:acetylornithine deacetylase/succinyl-diaminopimelate desuccinylase-like protein
MQFRRDALVATARVITGVEEMANALGEGTVATVGWISCEPNAINVIPGTVQFTIDLRSAIPSILAQGRGKIDQILTRQAGRCDWKIDVTENQRVVEMNDLVLGMLEEASFGDCEYTTSGALHDAAIVAPHMPTAMLFVASKGGISHNPAEFSRIEDIAGAAEILERLVRKNSYGFSKS